LHFTSPSPFSPAITASEERTKQLIVFKFFSRLHTLESALYQAFKFNQTQAEQVQLLGGCESNQPHFFNFLFNLSHLSADNGVVAELFLRLTAYAHRKC